MLPFCDTILVSNVFMLTDLQCCGQYHALSIIIMLMCDTIREKIVKDEQGWIGGMHQGISPGSTLSPPQTTSWPALLGYSEDPTITNKFFGSMAFCYSGVPSKSCKQTRACRKWTIKASRISIWHAECSQSSCGSNTKNNSNNLLSCQLHRIISYVARHVIKCVAVIEKVNYLKNCVCILPVYIPSWYSLDSGQYTPLK